MIIAILEPISICISIIELIAIIIEILELIAIIISIAGTNNPRGTRKPDNPLKGIRNPIIQNPDNTLKGIRDLIKNGTRSK